MHQRLLADEPRAAKLHCVYVPVPEVVDVSAEHLTWAHGELFRRPLSGIARAELLEFGVTVYGPDPAEVIPPVSRGELDDAVRGELSGYWRGVVAKPHLWLQDVYVDIGLFTLARAEATLTDGRLITKTEAIRGSPGSGRLPSWCARSNNAGGGRRCALTACTAGAGQGCPPDDGRRDHPVGRPGLRRRRSDCSA